MKNVMKKVMKFAKWTAIGLGALFAIVLVILIKDMSNDDQKAEAPAEAIEAPAEEETPAKEPATPVEAIEAPAEEETPEKSMAALEQFNLEIMQDNFEGIAEITFDEENKAYIILPTQKEMIQAIAFVQNGYALDSYNGMVEDFQGLSKSLEESLGSGYMISFLNPANPDNVLLIILDGEIVYNFID